MLTHDGTNVKRQHGRSRVTLARGRPGRVATDEARDLIDADLYTEHRASLHPAGRQVGHAGMYHRSICIMLFLVALGLASCAGSRARVNAYTDPAFDQATIKTVALLPMRNAQLSLADAMSINGRHIHTLRHSHCALAVACGVKDMELRLSVGHGGPAMTAHYANAAMLWRAKLKDWHGVFKLRDQAEVERIGKTAACLSTNACTVIA